MMRDYDAHYMRLALQISRRALGVAAPNPAVGCLIVIEPTSSGGLPRVVGRAATGPGGLPHAEELALEQAGKLARGASAYVTLEPCAHVGRRKSSCAQALIDAGIRRVVVAVRDKDARVNGEGIRCLQDAGLEVDEGLLMEEARESHLGFFLALEDRRPLVSVKMGTSIDGHSALAHGESQWITGARARDCVHELRFEHDAIMVGARTARIDNPRLTCRLPGFHEQSRVRIVLDACLNLSPDSLLLQTALQFPLWIFVAPDVPFEKRRIFEDRGAIFFESPVKEGFFDIPDILEILTQRGVRRLLVEGGSTLAASFVQADCVDYLEWFVAPCLLGSTARPSLGALCVDSLPSPFCFTLKEVSRVGDDCWMRYKALPNR